MYTLKSRQGGIVVRRWQLFLGIELALTLWLFFQIITNPMALTTILVGVFFLFLGARWHRLRSFNVAFGGILLVLGIFIIRPFGSF